jgi:hypothetical protein
VPFSSLCIKPAKWPGPDRPTEEGKLEDVRSRSNSIAVAVAVAVYWASLIMVHQKLLSVCATIAIVAFLCFILVSINHNNYTVFS